MRQHFNSGQEIIYQDLNTVSSILERQFYDRILKKILQGKTDAFFDDGMKVVYTGGTSALIKAGLGLHEVSSSGDKEPLNRPVWLESDEAITFSAPDAVNDRIDIVVVQTERSNVVQEDRKYKDEFSDTISTQSFTVVTDYAMAYQVVTGTPAGTPVAPSVPVGFIKVAEVLIESGTGMASQVNITDNRVLLPKAASVGGSGVLDYDSIVGPSSLIGTTHATLKEAIDQASSGFRILVLEKQDISVALQVTVANLEIDFKKGAYLEKAGATNALRISADDCSINNLRIVDFSGAGDIGLLIDSSMKRTIVREARFNNCDTQIDDSGTETYIPVSFTE